MPVSTSGKAARLLYKIRDLVIEISKVNQGAEGEAAVKKLFECIKTIDQYARNNAIPLDYSYDDISLLDGVVRTGSVEILWFFLDRGVSLGCNVVNDLSSVSNWGQYTIFHYLAESPWIENSDKLITCMLSHIDPDDGNFLLGAQAGREKVTALQLAVSQRNYRVCHAILNNCSDIKALLEGQDGNGVPALHYIFQCKDTGLIRGVLHRVADVSYLLSMQDRTGRAADHCITEETRELIDEFMRWHNRSCLGRLRDYRRLTQDQALLQSAGLQQAVRAILPVASAALNWSWAQTAAFVRKVTQSGDCSCQDIERAFTNKPLVAQFEYELAVIVGSKPVEVFKRVYQAHLIDAESATGLVKSRY